MALILLLETATTACSVALAKNDSILDVKEKNERNIHASSITLFIEEVLSSAGRTFRELDAVAVSKGPGSYTGLRIGVSAAKGICYALDIPLIAINTLEAMASGYISSREADHNTLYCPMIDARRMEVYTALFDVTLNPIIPVEAKILDDQSFEKELKDRKIVFFGDGAFKCAGLFNNEGVTIDTGFVNSARDMAKLSFEKYGRKDFEDVAYFEPFYLKDFLIQAPKAKSADPQLSK